MSAIVVQNVAFDIGPRKLVIFRVDRYDLPHLTISWDNASGEIDVHFTPQGGSQVMSVRESVAIFQQSEVRPFLESIGKELVQILKASVLEIIWSVRPGWLARNHYYLIGPEGELIVQWLHRAVPKIRGKHRLNMHVLKKIPSRAYYYPTTRRLIEFVQEGLIYAVCKTGYERGRVLILTNVSWTDGSLPWVGIDYQNLQRVARGVQKLLTGRLRSIAPDKVARVYDVLCLKEIGW